MGKELIEKIMEKIKQVANERREAAGHMGSYSDNGASGLEDQVKFYKYGAAGIIPPEWKKYEEQMKIEEDPDYAEWLRLDKKYGHLKRK